METQDFIELLRNVASDVLPILGVIVLIYVVLFFKKLIQTLKNVDATLQETTKLVEGVQAQVKKLDAPLETVNELSTTVDHIHEASKNAVQSTIAIVLNNLSGIKDSLFKSKNKESDDESEVVL